jgi:hypothetical protein
MSASADWSTLRPEVHALTINSANQAALSAFVSVSDRNSHNA